MTALIAYIVSFINWYKRKSRPFFIINYWQILYKVFYLMADYFSFKCMNYKIIKIAIDF